MLVVLIFLTIFASPSLFALQSITSTLKANHQLWLRQEHLQLAYQTLQNIENTFQVGNTSCDIPTTSAMILAMQSNGEWSQSHCGGNLAENRYYYVVESLGQDVCGYMDKIDINHPVIADYYRITLCVIAPNETDRVVLQSIIALPKSTILSCVDVPHVVGPGRQMARELKGNKGSVYDS